METKKYKRGELTSKQLITIIILIVSFTVIIIFFVALNLKGKVDKEACKNSIAMRSLYSTVGFKGINLGGLVKLKCETKKVCITTGKGCPEAGREVVVKKVLKNNLEENVMNEIAELHIDSWNMVFEGTKKFPGDHDLVIFYLVYFDDEIQDMLGILDAGEYYFGRLARLNISEDKTYFYYLFGYDSWSVPRSQQRIVLLDVNRLGSTFKPLDLGDPLAVVVWGQGVNVNSNIMEYNAGILRELEKKGIDIYVFF
jgi:hypothetical protein